MTVAQVGCRANRSCVAADRSASAKLPTILTIDVSRASLVERTTGILSDSCTRWSGAVTLTVMSSLAEKRLLVSRVMSYDQQIYDVYLPTEEDCDADSFEVAVGSTVSALYDGSMSRSCCSTVTSEPTVVSSSNALVAAREFSTRTVQVHVNFVDTCSAETILASAAYNAPRSTRIRTHVLSCTNCRIRFSIADHRMYIVHRRMHNCCMRRYFIECIVHIAKRLLQTTVSNVVLIGPNGEPTGCLAETTKLHTFN